MFYTSIPSAAPNGNRRSYQLGLLVLLLLHPNLHHKTMRQQLGEKHLHLYREAEYRHILAVRHVLQCFFDNIGSFVEAVVIGHRVVGHRSVEKLGLDPARSNRHDTYAFRVKLDVQRARKAEHERL